jgi:nicotinate-nucleotide adenylyltransferase
MRVGFLGGTFDPIHLGHLRAAECALSELGLDQVAFVPCHVPPHRDEPCSSALDRYAMVCLATAGVPRFVASDVELRREGPSYTVDTLEALLRERPGDQMFLIVGSDTFPDLRHWRNPGRLRRLCSVVVVPRPGSQPAFEDEAAPDGVQLVSGTELAISATAIRESVRGGRSVRFLVPPAVAEHIEKRGLYR